MNKLVTRSLQILGQAVKEIGTDYTSNITAFVNDAKDVKNTIVKDTTDAADTLAKIKNGGITKKISDWFFEEENSFDASIMTGDDEFDPGFKIEGSDDAKLDGEETSKPLTIDSMSDITNKQTSKMLKIGRRQTEQSVANTAEIVSVINSRSSEVVASINNVNKTLMGINERLDKIIKYTAVGVSEEQEKQLDKGGLYQDGKLSLMRIFEASKNSFADNQLIGGAKMIFDQIQSGNMGPSAIAKMGLETLLGKVKIGDKSVNELGRTLNDSIGVAIQTGMNELINTKAFKTIFNDITAFEGNKDYGTVVKNDYDSKRAVFDGMTRRSIVSVIPEMLANINESISGVKYHLNGRGQWIKGTVKNEFVEVVDNSFASSGLTSNAMTNISNAGKSTSYGKEIPSDDIELAGKALTMAIVSDLENKGSRSFTVSSLKKDMAYYITFACKALCRVNNDPIYWGMVCQIIISQLNNGLMDSSKFVANINQSLESMITSASDFAQSGKMNASQATRLSADMFINQFVERNKREESQSSEQSTSSSSNNNNNASSTGFLSPADRIKSEQRIVSGDYSSNEYIRGIFGILNRGINVKVLGKKSKGFGDYDITRKSVKQISEDDSAGQLIANALFNASNDDKGMEDAVKQGMKNALGDIVNAGQEEGVQGIIQAGSNDLKGFLSNTFSNAAGRGIGGLFDMATKGELKQGLMNIKDQAKQFISNKLPQGLSEATQTVRDHLPGSFKYDRRVSNAQSFIDNLPDTVQTGLGKASDKIHQGIDKAKQKTSEFIDSHDTVHKYVNNAMYRKDTLSMNRSENIVTNIDTETIQDFDDRYRAECAIQSLKYGNIDNAIDQASMIKNEELRSVIEDNLNNVKSIKEKREKGQSAIEAGGVADIGAVMDTHTTDTESKIGGMLDTVKSGFQKVSGFLQKITKWIIHIGKKGLMDIKYGLLTMKEGLLGTRQKDSDGNPIEGAEKGAIRNVLFEPIKLGATSIANAYNNSAIGQTINAGLSNAKDRMLNTVYTHGDRMQFDQNGQVMRHDNGSIVYNNERTVGDLLKEPKKILTESLHNLSNEIKNSGLGQAISGLVDGIKNGIGEVKDLFGNMKEKGGSFKTKLSDKIMTSDNVVARFAKGATSGFRKAKEAAEEAKRKQSKEADRNEHPTEASIEDALINNKESFLGKIHSSFDKLLEMIKKNHDEDMEATESDNDTNSSTDVDTSTQSLTSGSGDNSESHLTSGEGRHSNVNIGDVSNTTTATVSSHGDSSGGSGLMGGIKNIGKVIGDSFESFGKMFGGMFQAIMGVMEVVISALSGLSALQALKDMVSGIFEEGIKPLNKIFESLMDMLKPLADLLTTSLQILSEFVVTICDVLLGAIQPVIEALMPVIELLMQFIEPCLDLLSVIVEKALTPIVKLMDKVATGIEIITDCIKIIGGVVGVGFGFVVGFLGNLISAVGTVIHTIGLKSVGKKIKEVGTNAAESGESLMDSAKEMFKEGLQGIVIHTAKFLGFEADEPQEQRTGEVDTEQVKLRDEMGAGNVSTSTTTNNSYTYMYGSGNSTTMNQHTYGGFMNMGERGCGPVALADAFSRRTGVGVNPAMLAAKMSGNGNYDPRRGTSVGSMLNAGGALGMGMRVGGVTQSSLNQASPTNPITLLGSGAGFGTKYGNNHYVNVIGTDSNGGAYVSNPMSGRIERTSRSQLALNARLGLYGSGDNDDLYDTYGFTDEASEALERLQLMTQRLTSMFVGDSASEKFDREVQRAKEEEQATAIKIKMSEDEYAQIEQEAQALMREKYKKRDGESDEDYEKRMERMWKKYGNKYIVQAGSQKAIDKTSQMADAYLSGVDKAIEGTKNLTSTMKSISLDDGDGSGSNGSSGNSGSSGSSSYTGALMSPYSPINFKEPNITGDLSGDSPVHDYFSATSGYPAFTTNGGWFKKTRKPDKYGEGSEGDPHEGLSIWFNTDYDKSPEVKAITKGVVTWVDRGGKHGKEDPYGGLGNHVKFIDDSGMYHWFLHLADIDDKIQAGANISENQLIGHVGTTGATGERNDGNPAKFLRYILTRSGPYGSTGDPGYENPLKYWRFDEGSSAALPGTVGGEYGTNSSSSSANASGIPGSITADNGAVLADVGQSYKYTDVNMDDYVDEPGNPHKSGHSPIHEFFSKSSGKEVWTSSRWAGHWYWNRQNPDKQGRGQSNSGTGLQGSSGVEHGGVDFIFGNTEAGAELHAPTGGTVIDSKFTTGPGSAGAQIAWVDSGGKAHWFMHMRDMPLKKTGDTVNPGDLLGYTGQSGATSGGYNHLHYTIIDPEYAGVTTCRSDAGMLNPIDYFKNYTPMTGGTTSSGNANYSKNIPGMGSGASNAIKQGIQSIISAGFGGGWGGPGSMSSLMKQQSAWSSYKDKSGVPTFINKAKEAGMTPAQIAVMMSTGIWEDGGQKIFDTKSLTATTYDSNGQQATGIMNWVDTSVNYGSTVKEQLDYIRKTYFDANSTDSRAKMRHNQYDSADLTAYKAGTDRTEWGMDWDQKYGPVMESDLIAGSEQFFRGALVPACIHDASGVGVAKYIGTAVDAYNWLIDQGLASGNTIMTSSSGTADYSNSSGSSSGSNGSSGNSSSGGKSTSGRFYATMSNYEGSVPSSGGSSSGGSSSGGDEVVQAFAQVDDDGSSVVSGDSVATTWNTLLKLGMSPIGAAGMMGCFKYESGFGYNNLEDTFNNQFGLSDEQYTSNVDNGSESEDNFIHGRYATYIAGQTPGEAVGYGIAQFTSSDLKRDIYNATVKKGKSVSDPYAQLSTLIGQLKSRGIYNAIYSAPTPTEANKQFLWHYEAGTSYQSDSAVAAAYPWMGMSGINNRHNAAEEYYNKYKNTSTSSGNANYDSSVGFGGPVDTSFVTAMSGAVMAPFGQPTHTVPSISGDTSNASPLHDFFASTNGGAETVSYAGNWYNLRNSPNSMGQGMSGDTHSGLDINWVSGSADKEVHATTGGIVDHVEGGGGYNGGCGNNIRWMDDKGYLHWYMHMRDTPLANEGDSISPGQLLGYVGNTGNSFGAHLHYNVNNGNGFTGWSSSNTVNPIEYWSATNSNGVSVSNAYTGSSSGGVSLSDGGSSYSGIVDGPGIGGSSGGARQLASIATSANLKGGFTNASYWGGDSEYLGTDSTILGLGSHIINTASDAIKDSQKKKNSTIMSMGSNIVNKAASAINNTTNTSSSKPSNFIDYFGNALSDSFNTKKSKLSTIILNKAMTTAKQLQKSNNASDQQRAKTIEKLVNKANKSGLTDTEKDALMDALVDVGNGKLTSKSTISTIGQAVSESMGSGDSEVYYDDYSFIDPSMIMDTPTGNFWHESFTNTNTPQFIPPLDTSQLIDYNTNIPESVGYSPNITNNYNIKTDTSGKEALINKLGEMTFNVRAKRVEQLLEDLIQEVKNGKNKPVTTSSKPRTDLFTSNDIPSQVTRLSRG